MSRLRMALGGIVAASLLTLGGMLAYLLPASLNVPARGAANQPPSALAQSTTPQAPRVITVVAEGSANARPDRAWVTVGAQATRPTAAEALEASSQATEAVLAKLDELGIAREDVQTSGLSLHPVYADPSPQEPGGEPRITGYNASNQLTVMVNDLGRVGMVLDSVVAAGANTIGGVRFGLSDDNALRAQALEQAVRAARPKAETMARGLNVGVGEVLEAREQGAITPVPVAMPAARAAGGVPVEGGQLTVTTHVQVTFEMVVANP